MGKDRKDPYQLARKSPGREGDAIENGRWVEGLVLFGKKNTAVEHAASGIEDVRCRA